MPDKRLGVELTARERVSQAMERVERATRGVEDRLKTIPNTAGRVGRALGDMGKRGIQSLTDLAAKVFFLREAFQTLLDITTRLFESIIQPAVNLRKVTAALTNMTGSASAASKVLGDLQSLALRTGASFDELSAGIPDVVGRLRDAEGAFDPAQWDAYLEALNRVVAFRPDLSAAEQMQIVNDLMAGNVEAAAMALGKSQKRIEEALGVGEGSEQQLGRYTSILRGGEAVEKTATDVVQALDQLGIVGTNIDEAATALDRLRERWNAFKRAIGEKILDRVVEALIRLMDWLEANEETVVALADKIANYLVDAVIAFLDWLTPERLDAIAASIGSVADTVVRLVSAFLEMPGWAQKLLVGGALALGPMGGGKALGGLAMKGVGKLLGGGGAAAGAAGAGQAAAGGGAAAAGGLSALGVGGAVAGGLGLGLGVNELLSRTEWGKQAGVQSTRNIASVAAFGAGKLFGGEELGQEWFSKVAGVQPKQEVEVRVTVDDEGALRAYTQNEIGRNNDDIMSGWSGGGAQRSPAFAAWSGG